MTKYIAIVFFEDTSRPPIKFSNWINDKSIEKQQFQRFIKARYKDAIFANLYDKSTRKYSYRLKF